MNLELSSTVGPMHGPTALSGHSKTKSCVAGCPMASIVGPVGREGVSPPPFQFPLANKVKFEKATRCIFQTTAGGEIYFNHGQK